jgi:chromosome partitioning protein
MERLLTTREVADRLGTDTRTVRRYVQQHRLEATRDAGEYRIPERSVTALLLESDRHGSEPSGTRLGRVTALVNQKGGVGKTTTTFNLGVALRRLGRRVLLVDLDPQGALSVSAGVSLASLNVSIYQALLDDQVDPGTIVQPTVSGVDIMPATIDLAAAEIELVSMMQREYVLRDVLAHQRERYDHILIDCPPSLGLLTINALAAADQVLIPLQCEFLATRGLTLLLRTLTKVQAKLNPNLRIAGILPTMFDGRTTHAKEILEELRSSFPGQVYDIVIKSSVRVKESPAAGLSILDYDRNHDVSRAYMQLAREMDHD